MAHALAELSPRFIDLAAATAAARALDHPDSADPLMASWIALAVRRLLRRAMVISIGAAGLPAGGAALIPFHCNIDPTSKPGAIGRVAGRSSELSITVGPSWLVDVWATGTAVVGNGLTLAADLDSGRATVLEWQRRGLGAEPRVVEREIRS
jgi:hypothetical protein